MSNDVVEALPEDAIYFTTRKTKKGWICERVFAKDGVWNRELVDEPGSRGHAMERFKISVGRYWDEQRKQI